MDGRPLTRVRSVARRVVVRARRGRRAFSRWVEHTGNFVHLSVLVFLPLVLGAVTVLANAVELLPFLLFPPLASGTYTLFAHPEGRYASPRRFVGGITGGAFCGWVALELAARYWYAVPPGEFSVHAGAVAFGMLLTGGATWLFDVEEPSAFSAALLIHVVDVTGSASLTLVLAPGLTVVVGPRPAYVVSVFASTAFVAGAFLLWRERFYERRERFLYRSVEGDDHVLVPVRGETAEATAMLAARLAGAHEAGRVVLLDIVEDDSAASAERELLGGGEPDGGDEAAKEAADRLETLAGRVETKVGVPCEVVVAAGGARAATIRDAAEETGSDLIVVPYEPDGGRLAPHIRELFRTDTDVLVHRSRDGRTRWKRVLVPVRRAGDVAHAMIDFAARLGRRTGEVGVCHCIRAESERREAESMLADLAETVGVPVETRVSRADIADFLGAASGEYDLVIVGASTDRPRASRLIHRPTFERLDELDADVAIMDRNF